MAIDKKFVDQLAIVTSKAALASSYLVGKKDKISADKAAVDEMRTEINKINTYIKPTEKFPIDKKVTVIAIIIPKIPNKLPRLEVSGDDNPLKAKMNNTPEIK